LKAWYGTERRGNVTRLRCTRRWFWPRGWAPRPGAYGQRAG
jgi:hypothetical protein